MKYSIIVPVKELNDFIQEHFLRFEAFERTDLELIVLPNYQNELEFNKRNIKIVETGKVSPAVKRDMGARLANGEFLVFLDDDAYVEEEFFDVLDSFFDDYPKACVGGPAITPYSNNIKQKTSGAVFESTFLSSNPERYLSKGEIRKINDWPSVNLALPKEQFNISGGFGNEYWPGEDTLFCLKLLSHGIEIFYEPNLIAYHHRRETLRKHLNQVFAYGRHRGYFARKFPLNSRKLVYFIPFLFLFYTILILSIYLLLEFNFLSFETVVILHIPLFFYVLLLLIAAMEILFRHSLLVSFTSLAYFPLTHFTYAFGFTKGLFFTKTNKSRLR